MLKQMRVITFSREFLLTFTSWVEPQLEKMESIDMLRVLEHGEKIKFIYSDEELCGIDTFENLLEIEKGFFE